MDWLDLVSQVILIKIPIFLTTHLLTLQPTHICTCYCHNNANNKNIVTFIVFDFSQEPL